MLNDFPGLFFLGLGPGIVFFLVVIARKSFLVLLALFSAFLWLVVLLITSAIFRGFVPISAQKGPYAGVLAASVFIQEATRYGIWRMHRKSLTSLEAMAASKGHRFSALDKLYMAMAWGYGHGACQAIFFFLSMLPVVVSGGTYYTDMCPQMSVFLVGAIFSLAFGMILTCLMVIAFDGYMTRNFFHIGLAPVVHMGASMLTLVNFMHNGCPYSTSALLAIGVLLIVYTIGISLRRSGR